MRSFPRAAIAALLVFAVPAPPAFGQAPVTIPNSERWSIKSATTGAEYRIDVALPPGYQGGDGRYPTFYILDANLSFAMLADVYRLLRMGGQAPDVILVGVGYPEDDPKVMTPAYSANRGRDYTPTAMADEPTSGHAREFLSFLATELFPAVDGRYRTDPKDRGIGGHSLGGLFVTYALFHRPDLFRRYWLGSPSLWWGGGVAFSWKAEGDPSGRAFASVGSEESAVMVPPMKQMAAELAKSFPTLEVSSLVVRDETHMSSVPAALSRALTTLYHRPTITLSAAERAEYVGRWKGTKSGDVIVIAIRHGRLVATMPLVKQPVTIELQAEAKDRLYSTMTGGTFAFERDDRGHPVRLHRTGYGVEVDFVK